LDQTANNTAVANVNGNPEDKLKALRQVVQDGIVLTTTLGSAGSMVMNRVPYLIHASAAHVEEHSFVGAGDTFSTPATLSAGWQWRLFSG
jgi:fructose-1-phosphate kinase PfkB-like protein